MNKKNKKGKDMTKKSDRKKVITVKAKLYKPESKATKKGTKVELEHTPDKKLAGMIAGTHLDEDKKYYEKLEKVEKKAEKQKQLKEKKRG